MGESIQCPFHGWQWDAEGRNVCIPYEARPNRGRRMRTYPVVERNQGVYLWHDLARREPFFEVPDIFVIGYGLDYMEAYRNLPFVGVLRPQQNDGENKGPVEQAATENGKKNGPK